MTAVTAVLDVRPVVREPAATPRPRAVPGGRAGLLAVLVLQVVLALRTASLGTPFEDEGLYVYMGHRMIDHLLHGAFLSEYPGAYFSGAPGLYPVLAALGDSVGGLRGARAVSLLFALAATVCVHGLGRQLYGRLPGLLGALAFVLCGSVIYQSDFATFDSLTMFLVAAAAWLTVYSVRHDRFLWAPVVGVVLVLAFYAKYAGAVYAPVIAVLAVVAARRDERLLVLRRTAFMLASGLSVGYFVLAVWGQSLRDGIALTTTSRTVLNPAGTGSLLHQVALWVGPWLLLAGLGALLTRRSWRLSVVLLGGSVVAPLQQIRIGEATSLAKHVAFGMVFAAPLIGLVLSRALAHRRVVTVPVVGVVLLGLGATGTHYAHQFLTGWVDDAAVVHPLGQLIAATPGKPILGEQPAPERYALRASTAPVLWTDTYSFGYDHKVGPAAYREAVDQTSFGAIFLVKQPYALRPDGSPTANGSAVYRYLTTQPTPYRLAGEVPRSLHGKVVGAWYLFLPRASPLPPGWARSAAAAAAAADLTIPGTAR